MDKSPEAFRTISEVADWLDVPTHVLRFWESRFSQVKPVKRAGGRRYYRPADMRLIGGIKRLLHDDGMTIRSVQKLLREEGVKHVAQFSQPLDHEKSGAHEASIFRHEPEDAAPAPPEVPAAEEQFPVSADEDLADAAWESEPEPVGAGDGSLPPAPSDAEVVAFGSVRSRADEEEPHVEPEASEAVAEMPVPDVVEPEQPDFLDQDAAATATPPPPRAVPIVANAPEDDPDDDDEGHTRPASSTSRVLTMDPALLRKDPIKIEQVVAALRAVRDRSSR